MRDALDILRRGSVSSSSSSAAAAAAASYVELYRRFDVGAKQLMRQVEQRRSECASDVGSGLTNQGSEVVVCRTEL
jgi:hypothetical protein